MDEKKIVEEKEVKENNAPVEKEAVITDGDKEQSKPVVDGSAEAYINIEGEPEQEEVARALILEDSYDGTIVSVALQSMRVWSKKGLDLGKENKFLFSVLIDGENDKDGSEIVLPMFVKPKVNPAYKVGVSNTKLYDILSESDLLVSLADITRKVSIEGGKFSEENLRAFLEANLQGKLVRVEVKTVNKDDPKKASYSRVKSILLFKSQEVK